MLPDRAGEKAHNPETDLKISGKYGCLGFLLLIGLPPLLSCILTAVGPHITAAPISGFTYWRGPNPPYILASSGVQVSPDDLLANHIQTGKSYLLDCTLFDDIYEFGCIAQVSDNMQNSTESVFFTLEPENGFIELKVGHYK